MLAENNGKISHTYRAQMMGHASDIESIYTMNKGSLPPQVVEDMREGYTDSEPYLSTEKMSTDPEEFKNMILEYTRKQAQLHNINIQDIELQVQREMLDTNKQIELYQEEIVKITAPQAIIKKPGEQYTNGTGAEHKMVTEKELVPHLNEGWTLERELSNSKYLVMK
jgi:GTPase SAR1 family protein